MSEQTVMSFADKIKAVQKYYNDNKQNIINSINSMNTGDKKPTMTINSPIHNEYIDGIVSYINSNITNERLKNDSKLELKEVVIALALESQEPVVVSDQPTPENIYPAYQQLHKDLLSLLDKQLMLPHNEYDMSIFKLPDNYADADNKDELIKNCNMMKDYIDNTIDIPKIIKYKYANLPKLTQPQPQAGGRRSRRRRSRKSKATRKNKKLTRRTRRK